MDGKNKADTYTYSDNNSFASFSSDSGTTARWKRIVKDNIFLIFLLVGICTGIAMGIGIRANYPDFGEDNRNLMYLAFPGQLLLRMLKCCIIPLIVTSLISGMAAIPGKSTGRLGGLTILYYMSTTFMAVLLGILLVCTIKPGERRFDDTVRIPRDKLVEPVDALLDLIRNALPDNIIEACSMQIVTTYTEKNIVVNKTMDNGTTYLANETEIVDFSVGKKSGTNVLGLVVFCVVLGVIIGKMGQSGLPVKRFVDSLQEAIIWIVKLVIWYSPIGIAFILAERIVGMDDPVAAFESLGWYIMTVLVGLFIHGFIILPLIYFACSRRNPFWLMLRVSQALLTALGTASSSATLPITLQNIEERAGVDKRVTRFMLPVGATINMDGTALYEAVASIFIAQLNNYSLSAGQIVTVSITATAAAIGAAGVPEAGLVTMVIVLTAVGLPTEDIGLIFAVDWFLDRFRTMINVWGDCVGAGSVNALCSNYLKTLAPYGGEEDTAAPGPDGEKPARLSGRDNSGFDQYQMGTEGKYHSRL